jgi:tRNA-modifying protein YgfZ
MSHRSPLHEMTDNIGATYADDAGWSMPLHYGDPKDEYERARTGSVLFDISHHGKIEVAGKDAPTFLHNMCTNDIVNMPLGAGCEAFFCNQKAKVIAHTLIYHVRRADGSDAFWLDVAPGQAAKLMQHLDHFIIAEQVELTDKTGEFCQVHLAGPAARAVLTRALADEVPHLDPLLHMERTFGATVHSHIRRHDPLGVPGYDILCLNALAPGLWRMLTESGAKPAGSAAYDALRIEAGTPVYGRDIDEDRFAFDIGRTPQAISYDKGCYLGQEPIVMARDRAGHAPRTLMGLKLAGDQLVARGDKVFHGGEEVGFVTSSARSFRLGRAIALAYLRHGHQTPGTALEVRTSNGPIAAEASTLPIA